MFEDWLFHRGFPWAVVCIFIIGFVSTAYGQTDHVSKLIAALKDQNTDVRQQAAHGLGEIKDPRAVGPLIDTLKDPAEFPRSSATWALGEIGDPRAVGPLIDALKDADPEIRERAATALGKIKDPRAVDALITTLKDENPDVRSAATAALEGIKDPRAVHAAVTVRVDALIAALRAPILGPDVPLIAPINAPGATLDAEQAREELVKIGDPAVQPLIAALKDKDPHIRGGAALALGEIKDSRAIDPLIAALRDENAGTRSAAVAALGEIKDARAMDALIAARSAPKRLTSLVIRDIQPNGNYQTGDNLTVGVGGQSFILLKDQKGNLTMESTNMFAGTEHRIKGEIEIRGWRFYGEIVDPLVFKLIRAKGYVYQRGSGIVIDPRGRVFQLGNI
jgi:HEAT repeat protein